MIRALKVLREAGESSIVFVVAAYAAIVMLLFRALEVAGVVA